MRPILICLIILQSNFRPLYALNLYNDAEQIPPFSSPQLQNGGAYYNPQISSNNLFTNRPNLFNDGNYQMFQDSADNMYINGRPPLQNGGVYHNPQNSENNMYRPFAINSEENQISPNLKNNMHKKGRPHLQNGGVYHNNQNSGNNMYRPFAINSEEDQISPNLKNNMHKKGRPQLQNGGVYHNRQNSGNNMYRPFAINSEEDQISPNLKNNMHKKGRPQLQNGGVYHNRQNSGNNMYRPFAINSEEDQISPNLKNNMHKKGRPHLQNGGVYHNPQNSGNNTYRPFAINSEENQISPNLKNNMHKKGRPHPQYSGGDKYINRPHININGEEYQFPQNDNTPRLIISAKKFEIPQHPGVSININTPHLYNGEKHKIPQMGSKHHNFNIGKENSAPEHIQTAVQAPKQLMNTLQFLKQFQKYKNTEIIKPPVTEIYNFELDIGTEIPVQENTEAPAEENTEPVPEIEEEIISPKKNYDLENDNTESYLENIETVTPAQEKSSDEQIPNVYQTTESQNTENYKLKENIDTETSNPDNTDTDKQHIIENELEMKPKCPYSTGETNAPFLTSRLPDMFKLWKNISTNFKPDPEQVQVQLLPIMLPVIIMQQNNSKPCNTKVEQIEIISPTITPKAEISTTAPTAEISTENIHTTDSAESSEEEDDDDDDYDDGPFWQESKENSEELSIPVTTSTTERIRVNSTSFPELEEIESFKTTPTQIKETKEVTPISTIYTEPFDISTLSPKSTQPEEIVLSSTPKYSAEIDLNVKALPKFESKERAGGARRAIHTNRNKLRNISQANASEDDPKLIYEPPRQIITNENRWPKRKQPQDTFYKHYETENTPNVEYGIDFESSRPVFMNKNRNKTHPIRNPPQQQNVFQFYETENPPNVDPRLIYEPPRQITTNQNRWPIRKQPQGKPPKVEPKIFYEPLKQNIANENEWYMSQLKKQPQETEFNFYKTKNIPKVHSGLMVKPIVTNENEYSMTSLRNPPQGTIYKVYKTKNIPNIESRMTYKYPETIVTNGMPLVRKPPQETVYKIYRTGRTPKVALKKVFIHRKSRRAARSAVAFIKIAHDKDINFELLEESLKNPNKLSKEEKGLLDTLISSAELISEKANLCLEKTDKTYSVLVLVLPRKSVNNMSQAIRKLETNQNNLEHSIHSLNEDIYTLSKVQKLHIIREAIKVLKQLNNVEVNFETILKVFEFIPINYVNYEDKIFKMNPYRSENDFSRYDCNSIKELRSKVQYMIFNEMDIEKIAEKMKDIFNILWLKIKHAPESKNKITQIAQIL